MAEAVAARLSSLREAFLTPNRLSSHIISNLQSYPHLRDLHISGLDPSNYIWNAATPVSIKNLKWECSGSWATAQYLLQVAKLTCPDLDSLDVLYSNKISDDTSHLPRVPARALHYQTNENSPPPLLSRLRHFGFRYRCPEEEETLVRFLEVNRESLQSLSIPLESAEFAMKVIELLPNLEELSIACHPDYTEFLPRITGKLASPSYSIKKLEIPSMGSSFSACTGKLFQKFRNLKILRVGDKQNKFGPYDNDGQPDFAKYRSVSLFVQRSSTLVAEC